MRRVSVSLCSGLSMRPHVDFVVARIFLVITSKLSKGDSRFASKHFDERLIAIEEILGFIGAVAEALSKRVMITSAGS